MTISDPVASMLTIIRNANIRGCKTVVLPYSSFKWRICKKLETNNFLSQCWFDEKNKTIKADIKYSNQNSRIHQIKKVSKPSQHIHLQAKEIRKYCHSRGTIYFISTSSGLLTHHEALEKNIGGKVIFFIN